MGQPIPPIQPYFGTGRIVWHEAQDAARPVNYLLAMQVETPHRCPYCQTLILTTAAVRCGSCGAPR
ncbi:hypothetical protein [Geothrix campi]|uniref:hypothetical protein n=1 Tax=Geothrix campi TaxID=2966450 RepID=UPI00214742A5|nr:hypothetical protein [Geothrix sp. SG10]